MSSTKTRPAATFDGIDHEDMEIHVQVDDTRRSYCGRDLGAADMFYVQPSEVTEAAWCRECVRVQDGC